MSFHRLNQYKEKKTIPILINSNTPPANTKSTKSTNKSSTDRPLPRTSPPGNFNVNYDTLEIRIPNYTFGKAIELAGAGGLIAVSLGKRYKKNKTKEIVKFILKKKFISVVEIQTIKLF